MDTTGLTQQQVEQEDELAQGELATGALGGDAQEGGLEEDVQHSLAKEAWHLSEAEKDSSGGRKPLVSKVTGIFKKKEYVSADSVHELYGKWTAPDESLAQLKYHERHAHHQVHDVKLAHVQDLKEFGAGHMLYFYFLKYCAFMFALLAFCPGAIQITMNAAGGFLSELADFDTLTLGNFGLQSSNVNAANLNISLPSSNAGADAEIVLLKLFLADAENPSIKMDTIHFDKRASIVTMSAIDLMMTVVFFGFCLFLIWNTKRLTKLADDHTVTIADYAVRVQFVPKDVTKDELKAYFEQWGTVVQVDLARRCSELVALVEDRQKILHALDLAIAKLQREADKYPMVKEDYELSVMDYKYDLSLVNEAIKAIQLGQQGEDVVEVYITFIDDISRDRCIDAQPKSWTKRKLQDKALRFRQELTLLVTSAPEPTDIQFENLQVMAGERFARRAATLLLKVILIAAGFTAVSMAPAIRRSLGATTSKPDEAACDDACEWKNSAGNLFVPEEKREVYKSCFEDNIHPVTGAACGSERICYECFCKTALQQSMYEERDYCSRFENVLLVATAAQALSVVVIVTVNLTVKILIQRLSRLEKHHTRSKETRSITGALAATQVLNFAVSIVVANAYLPRAQASMGDSKARLIFFGGIYSDLTPNWYRDVGKPIMVSHLLGILVRMALIGLPILLRWVRMKRRSKALTQAQMNAAYMGHEFQIAIRYGEHLTAIFVCWLFSSGMPLMYWSCAVSFALHFWVEKYELLKVCSYPINYSSDLMAFVASVLPISTILHLLGACWAYSVIGVPRSPLAGGGSRPVLETVALAFRGLWRHTTGLSAKQVADRLAQNNSMHLLYGILVLVFVLIAFQTWRKWLEWADWCLICSRDFVRDPKHAIQGLRSGSDKLPENPPDEGRRAKLPPYMTDAAMEILGEGDPDKEEVVMSGVPEFPLAVRSKLLGGPSTYDICKNPLYEHYFERLEDFWMEEAALAKVEAREREAMTRMRAVAAAIPGLIPRDQARRAQRRQKAREMLDRHGYALTLAGEATQHVQRAIYADRFAKRLKQAAAARRKAEAREERRRKAGGRVRPLHAPSTDAPMISFSAAKAHAIGLRAQPVLPVGADVGVGRPSGPGMEPWVAREQQQQQLPDLSYISTVPAHAPPADMVMRRHTGGGARDSRRGGGTPADTPDEPAPWAVPDR